LPPVQTLEGHIYACNSGSPTTTEVTGGTLAASGPSTVSSQANPLAPTQVDAGSYTVTAGAPAGNQFVICGGTSTVNTPTTATESVSVASGGAGIGTFYVSPYQTLEGHIYACSSGSPTTTEVTGGTLAATGPSTIASQANPLDPVSVNAGSFTMAAGAPSGYQFDTCGGTSTVTTPTTATESVSVASGGAGIGTFYVTIVPLAVLTYTGPPGTCPSDVVLGDNTTVQLCQGTSTNAPIIAAVFQPAQNNTCTNPQFLFTDITAASGTFTQGSTTVPVTLGNADNPSPVVEWFNSSLDYNNGPITFTLNSVTYGSGTTCA
jgi:hypothetical protein